MWCEIVVEPLSNSTGGSLDSSVVITPSLDSAGGHDDADSPEEEDTKERKEDEEKRREEEDTELMIDADLILDSFTAGNNDEESFSPDSPTLDVDVESTPDSTDFDSDSEDIDGDSVDYEEHGSDVEGIISEEGEDFVVLSDEDQG